MQNKVSLQQHFAATMQLVRSFNYFSYMHQNACRNGFLMALLQDAKLRVQTMDGSTEKRFYSGCNSLLNKFVQLKSEQFY
jgi:hypothetical protein